MVRQTGIYFALVVFLSLWAQSPSPAQDPYERLEAAVYADNPTEIKAAIKAGVSPNSGNYSGHFLGIAATYGRMKAVKALVESGADVNYTTSGGWTAAMGAADNGHLDILRYLAAKKADLNARTRMGRTLLMRASYHGRTEVVQYLLSKGNKVNDADMNGTTALMLAAQQGHDQTVKVLLDAGADRGLRNSNNKTALLLAQEAQQASGSYRAEEYKRTIALLMQGKKSAGRLIGKVFRADGKKLEIIGEGISSASRGSKLRIKTDDGDISATVTETLHSKIKANAAKSGASKGNPVYLEK